MNDRKEKGTQERQTKNASLGQEKIPVPREKCVAILKHKDGRVERREL